jgi:hypothetical protein
MERKRKRKRERERERRERTNIIKGKEQEIGNDSPLTIVGISTLKAEVCDKIRSTEDI